MDSFFVREVFLFFKIVLIQIRFWLFWSEFSKFFLCTLNLFPMKSLWWGGASVFLVSFSCFIKCFGNNFLNSVNFYHFFSLF